VRLIAIFPSSALYKTTHEITPDVRATSTKRTKSRDSGLVWQRVLLIYAGYADGNDSNFLRHDAAIKLAMGLGIGDDDYLASQPTISRLENNLASKDCYRIAAYMVMAYISRKSKAPKEIVLDFDGSCVPVHGDQQGTSYRKYYDTNMYFPLFVYDEDGWLICAILRPGRDGEARLTVPVLKRLVKALRTAWSHVRIIVRVDAAFGAQALYDWCEDQGKDDERDVVYYIVCLKAPADGRGVSVAFKQMRAEAGKLEYKALEGDKFSCREFTANQARLIFHALADNTMYQLRESLPGARHSWSFQTIQKYLIRMATKISKKGNEIVMQWASDFQWKREFWTCVARLRPKVA